MAKVIRFTDLPVLEHQAGDTVAAYRDGQVVRIAVPDGGGDLPELATVATTGQYSDLLGRPTLGTASSMSASSFATAEQGSKAETALQPADIGATIQAYSAILAGTTASFTVALKAKLDGVEAGATKNATDAALRDRSTHTGSQAMSTITGLDAALGGKVDKVSGKGLSTNDYTTTEKSKLAGVEAGAQVNAVTSVAGKTGAVMLTKGDVGLGSVDNTSDADKPISTAVSSALSGKVDTSDARLTNSREWTASTVGQAEAEAGTATTRRAWTAQRVWQAITAWWNASAAKSKLDGIQAGATANQTDAYLLNRANHTGTQAASTITGLATVATTGSYNDLTGKPSIPAGTVTSVGLSAPTGFSVSGSPVTGSGTLALTFASGYSLPTTAKQGQWDTAYGWGNHASAGYLTAASIANMVTTNTAQTITGQKTVTSDIRFDGSAAAYIRPETTGGWARGFWWMTRPTDTPANTRIGGIGVLGSGQTVTKFYVGFGDSPWTGAGNTVEFYANYTNIKYSLRVDGVEVATQAYTYSKTEVDALISSATSGGSVWQATTSALPRNTSSKVDFSTPRTLTLPSSPSENEYVEILKTAGYTNGSTIARNGQTIMGQAENLTLDADISYIRFDFVNGSWRIAS